MAKKIKISQEELKAYDSVTQSKKKKKSRIAILFMILTIILTISLIGSIIYFNNEIASLRKENRSLNKKNAQLLIDKNYAQSELNDITGIRTTGYIKHKLNFFDQNIVFKIEGFGNYYYTYDCMMSKVNGSYSYWAYNKEAAIGNGLKAGGC